MVKLSSPERVCRLEIQALCREGSVAWVLSRESVLVRSSAVRLKVPHYFPWSARYVIIGCFDVFA